MLTPYLYFIMLLGHIMCENNDNDTICELNTTLCISNSSILLTEDKQTAETNSSTSEEVQTTDTNSSLLVLSEEVQTTEIFTEETISTTVRDGIEITSTIKDDTSSDSTTELTTTTIETMTQTPPEYHISDDICFCDLTPFTCDINCCCDSDCSNFDRRSFSDCKRIKHQFDTRYCHKTNFLYKTNTEYKIQVDDHGLFCIFKDNLPARLLYKSKPMIVNDKDFEKATNTKKKYHVNYDIINKPMFESKSYKSNDLLWILSKNILIPFSVPHQALNSQCSTKKYVYFLNDSSNTCINTVPKTKSECEKISIHNMLYYIYNIKFISSPSLFNESVLSSSKICTSQTCLDIEVFICNKNFNASNCKRKILLPNYNSQSGVCQNVVESIKFLFYHNGTKGITKVRFYFILNAFNIGKEYYYENFALEFKWTSSNDSVKRSGNPGYLIGTPIMAGKKIYMAQNDTALPKKEAILLSDNSEDWLSVFGNFKGYCKYTPRVPILFKEDTTHSCILPLTVQNFTKQGCNFIQKIIFETLIGEDITNVSHSNVFNKYVATYGNSKVEETGDWVHVILDLLSLTSSHISFKSNDNAKICRNMITTLKITIVFSKFGSVSNPQSKILGVSMHFGKPVDLVFDCSYNFCKTNDKYQTYKLIESVNFIDVTEPAVEEFAQPPGIEFKLPHDFFYPFTSSSPPRCYNSLVVIIFCSLFIYII